MMNYDEYFTKAVLPHVEHNEDLKQCAYVWGKAAWDKALLCDISVCKCDGIRSASTKCAW